MPSPQNNALGGNAPPTNGDFQVPKLQDVRLDEVVVPEYQRMRIDKWANEIAQAWNPLLFRPPLLGRRADGKLDVIDGQHTIEALRIRGHDTVPAFVRDTMPTEDEAGAFADLNTRRRGLRPFEVWRAEHLAGRGWAVTLNDIAAKYGLKVAHERGPNNIACIGQCRIIFRKDHGAELLDQALDILVHAFDDTYDPANETRVERGLVSGMVDLLERSQPSRGFFDRDRFIDKLRSATFKTGDGTTVKLTPRSFPSYIARLIESGKLQLTSVQTGSGQAVIHGKALSLAILGEAKTKQLYRTA